MKGGLFAVVGCLMATGACGPSAEQCAADPGALDEQAIRKTLDTFVDRGQPFEDGLRSVSVSELRKIGEGGLVYEGEQLNESGNEIQLFAYRTRTDPVVQVIVARDTRDACHREVSMRIPDSADLAE